MTESTIDKPLPKRSSAPVGVVACHDCDTLYEIQALHERERAVCGQCGAVLADCKPNAVQRTTAFTLSAALLFLVANFSPFITLSVAGQENGMELIRALGVLQRHDSPLLAAAVAVFILAMPLLLIGGLLYITLPLLQRRRLPGAMTLCRWIYAANQWNMIEVFYLGALVSLLKLWHLADVSLGIGFWAFAGLIICLTAAVGSMDKRETWEKLEHATE